MLNPPETLHTSPGQRVDGLEIERLDGNNEMVIRYFKSEELEELVKQHLIQARLAIAPDLSFVAGDDTTGRFSRWLRGAMKGR